jgi:hypothetical protein
MAKWRAFAETDKMASLQPAIYAGIESLEKYYNKSDNSPIHIISMCEQANICTCALLSNLTLQ